MRRHGSILGNAIASRAKLLPIPSPTLRFAGAVGMLRRTMGVETKAPKGYELLPEPVAIDFTTENGVVSVYDRNIEYGVEVGGQSFDIVVSDAFFRHELNCGDCPVTEGEFLILRSAP